MKHINILILISFFFSCTNNNQSIITIDLNNIEPNIPYSKFIDSVSYITLDVDSFQIGGISTLYVADNKTFIKDSNRKGLLIFGKDNKLIKTINYFGPGPKEFIGISNFTIDSEKQEICIHDNNGQKIILYTYNGDYINSYPLKEDVFDIAYLKNNTYIFITPLFNKNAPCGVWSKNLSNGIITYLKNDIPQDAKTAFSSQFYQRTHNSIYYYDRINDDFSYINEKGANILYQFNLKQKVPNHIRKNPNSNINGYAMIQAFANSKKYLLLNYFTYGEKKYTWLLLDKKNNSINISSQLYNDIDNIQIDLNSLYYINDSTLCRALDPEEENYNIKLQILHLK